MAFTPGTTGSVLAFVAIVVGVIVLFFLGVAHAFRSSPARSRILLKTGVVVFAWLGLLLALVASGTVATLPFSGLPVLFGLILAVVIIAGASPFGGQLAAGIPLAALVGFQGFRLPLELVLHAWAGQGTIPGTMTWTGHNWDIVSGVVALACAPLASRHRSAAWLANVIGSVLLLNVARVVVLSSPLPFAWQVKPPLLLALHLPYMLIGPVCVGGALLGHIVLTRRLLRSGRLAKRSGENGAVR